jgi:hypothetical protein
MRHWRTPDLEHNTAEAVLFWSSLIADAWKELLRPTRGKRPTDKLMIGGPAKGVRFIHRSQIPASFRSNPSKRWVIAIRYKEEMSPS